MEPKLQKEKRKSRWQLDLRLVHTHSEVFLLPPGHVDMSSDAISSV